MSDSTGQTIGSIELPLDGSFTRPRRASWATRRLALGLSPTPRPGLVLVIVGMAVGPHGLGLLSPSVLTSLDPALSMALAALGVLVGVEINVRQPRQEGRLFAAATVESGFTILMVLGGMALLQLRSSAHMTWLVALMLGVCAASSSTSTDDAAGPEAATRVGDFDDVLPIVVSVAALQATHPGPAQALVLFAAQTAAIGVVIAGASWLLLTQTSSESEQRVFFIGTLLLLGGAAAHLLVSPLLIGLTAGLFWNAVGGAARDCVVRDAEYVQHPLMVLLLVIAGARLEVTSGTAALVLAYVVFRTAGKLLGGWAAGRVARELPRDFGFSLLAPGLVGVAIALNVLQTQPESDVAARIFTVAVTGSLALDLVSALVVRPSERS